MGCLAQHQRHWKSVPSQPKSGQLLKLLFFSAESLSLTCSLTCLPSADLFSRSLSLAFPRVPLRSNLWSRHVQIAYPKTSLPRDIDTAPKAVVSDATPLICPASAFSPPAYSTLCTDIPKPCLHYPDSSGVYQAGAVGPVRNAWSDGIWSNGCKRA